MIEQVLQKLVIVFGGDTKLFDDSIDDALGKVKKMEDSLMSFGTRASLAITAPLAAFQATSVHAFAGFDDAMTKSTAIMTGMTDEIEAQMSKQAKAIAMDSVTSAKNLASAYYFLASAGKTAEQAVASLSTVNAFAVAGDFEMARATEMLADTQAALGLAVTDATEDMKNMQRVSDVLVKGNIIANASTEQFAKSLTTKSGAALRLLNKDIEEGVAVLAAYAAQGVKGEMAGEKLSIMLRESQHAQLMHNAEWKKLGVNLYDSQGKMVPVVNLIEQLETLMAGMSDETKNATFDMLGFRSESMGAIAPLLGQSAAIREYERQLRSASGTTKDIEKNQRSFASEMTIMKNKLEVVAIEVGEVLAPRLQFMNAILSEMIDFWRELNPGIQEFVIYASSVAAAAGPAAIALGYTVRYGRELLPIMKALGSVASGAFTLIRTAALTALAPLLPWILGAAAVAGAVYGIAYAIMGPEGMADAWEYASSQVSYAWNVVMGFVENFHHNVGALMVWFRDNWSTILYDMGQMIMVFASNTIENWFTIQWTGIRLFSAFTGWLSTVIPAVWKYVFSDEFALAVAMGASKVLAFMGDLFMSIFTTVTSVMAGVKDVLVGMSITMVEIMADAGVMIRDIFMGIITGDFPDPFAMLAELGEKAAIRTAILAAKVADDVKGAIEPVTEAMAKATQELSNDFQAGAENMNFLDTAGDILGEQINKLKGPLEGFEASTITGPNLILSRTTENLEKEVAQFTSTGLKGSEELAKEITDVTAAKAELAKPVLFTVKGDFEAVSKDSAEALARLDKYRNAVTVTSSLSTEAKSKEGSKKGEEKKERMESILDAIEQNTRKDKNQIVIKSAELTGAKS